MSKYLPWGPIALVCVAGFVVALINLNFIGIVAFGALGYYPVKKTYEAYKTL
jgi:hypothetical protein